jgi:hypothetical protein
MLTSCGHDRATLPNAGLDFGLRMVGRRDSPRPRDRQLAAIDAVFAMEQAMSARAGMMDVSTTPRVTRGTRPR